MKTKQPNRHPTNYLIRHYSMLVGDKEIVKEYKFRSELEILDSEIDFFSLLITEMDNQEIINKRNNGKLERNYRK